VAIKPDWRDLEREAVMRELFGDFRNVTHASSTPRRTSYVIPPPPDILLVTYIGGPKNGTQDFVENWVKNNWADGSIRNFVEPGPINPSPGDPSRAVCETFRYKLAFINLAQTPFTEMQCCIALFQP
jgi:hypothetical protein